jgi:hypothetical protein
VHRSVDLGMRKEDIRLPLKKRKRKKKKQKKKVLGDMLQL